MISCSLVTWLPIISSSPGRSSGRRRSHAAGLTRTVCLDQHAGNNGDLNDETAKLFKECETDFGISQIVEIGDTNKPYSSIAIACNVNENLALAVEGKSADWPGVGISVSPVGSIRPGN